MNSENEANLKFMAREIVAEMLRSNGAQMLPVTTPGALQACGTVMPTNGCENLLYAPITTQRFYRSGRTDIDEILEGLVPVVPGSAVLLAQDARPPWPTGCYSLACSPLSPEATPPSETMIAPTTTSMPATQPPTSVPVTQSSVVRPNLPAGWYTQLETISPQNWTQLQLLQTFPAEMPMVHSVVVIEPDGKTLVLGNSNKAQLSFFDLESGAISSKSLYIHDVENVDVPFKAIKYLSDASIIVSSDSPYMIYHIDSAGNILSAWDGIEFAISADEKNLALEVGEGTSIINIANNEPIALLENSNGLGFSFSPDNSKIAIEASYCGLR